jgi:protein required for attachment to host cells
MSLVHRLLVVIADGEHVRFVRQGENNALYSDVVMNAVSAHKKAADLGSDRPGASVHTGSTAHHALAPRHDPHQQEKAKFAHTIAEQINLAADTFGELVIVAPSATLTAIREHLDHVTEAKIVGTLKKDLVKTPDDALWPHLRPWVRPVLRRAV